MDFRWAKRPARRIEERAANVWQLAGERKFDCLHVWQRDLHEPGYRSYEPGPTELAAEVEAAIRGQRGRVVQGSGFSDRQNMKCAHPSAG